MFKSLVFAVALLLTPIASFAAETKKPIELDLKVVTLILPFQDLSAPYLYDVVNRQSLIGLETPIARSGKVKAVAGAADVEGSDKALPYIGADVEISEKYFGERFNLGGWIAYDFDTKENRGGLKASIKLW